MRSQVRGKPARYVSCCAHVQRGELSVASPSLQLVQYNNSIAVYSRSTTRGSQNYTASESWHYRKQKFTCTVIL